MKKRRQPKGRDGLKENSVVLFGRLVSGRWFLLPCKMPPFLVRMGDISLKYNCNLIDEMSDGKMDKATLRWKKIGEYLKTHDYIMNDDVRELCGVSAATANRTLAKLVAEEKLQKCRIGGHWAYFCSGTLIRH